ncbi:GINS3 [Cordylochernes scorpioides]|uniref:DNA replication complex GINS protein PSF3 n=1 Tax=Cordylochernes scorpioides TaxID=51811 RepID=A0ABY6K0I6_9ARAC|nr:GINS3 [Cordylochernes scorpioides]
MTVLAGFLLPSAEGTELGPGSRVELPLHLARDLQRQRLLQVEMPAPYTEVYCRSISADPPAADLRHMKPYFYLLGDKLQRIVADSNQLSDTLSQSLRERFRPILDHSQNTDTVPSSFDHTETELYHLGRHSQQELESWQDRSHDRIATAPLVARHKRRLQVAAADG